MLLADERGEIPPCVVARDWMVDYDRDSHVDQPMVGYPDRSKPGMIKTAWELSRTEYGSLSALIIMMSWIPVR